ncbi:MAG: flagellar hook-basal body protein [Syntrophobacteraceae bacterium]
MGINTALYNGVTGLNSFSSAISLVSDNVANANTTAYKSNSIHFGDLVNTYYSMVSNDQESEGAGSAVLNIASDTAQGTLQSSSNWSDLAMSGEGYFSVQDSSGDVYYTRDGSFYLGAQTAGASPLLNSQGYAVLGYAVSDGTTTPPTYSADVSAIMLTDPQDYTSIRVESDGQIVGIAAGGVETPLYQVALNTFSNKSGLVRQGGNLYVAGPEVGQVYNNSANPELFGQVCDYTLEGSNVDMAEQMVNMIIYQASYNANAKVITTSKDMIDTTINMIR